MSLTPHERPFVALIATWKYDTIEYIDFKDQVLQTILEFGSSFGGKAIDQRKDEAIV